jgi:hypothetical protein
MCGTDPRPASDFCVAPLVDSDSALTRVLRMFSLNALTVLLPNMIQDIAFLSFSVYHQDMFCPQCSILTCGDLSGRKDIVIP